jgi:hypothetical protein
LENAGELAVAVRNVLPVCAVGEGHDDEAERREGLVDVLGLLEDRAVGARLGDFLGAGKIDKIQLAGLDAALDSVLLCDLHEEDGVGPGADVVHVGRGHRAPLRPRAHHLHDLFGRLHVELGGVTHVHAALAVLMDLEVVIAVAQEIADLLHVNLKV